MTRIKRILLAERIERAVMEKPVIDRQRYLQKLKKIKLKTRLSFPHKLFVSIAESGTVKKRPSIETIIQYRTPLKGAF